MLGCEFAVMSMTTEIPEDMWKHLDENYPPKLAKHPREAYTECTKQANLQSTTNDSSPCIDRSFEKKKGAAGSAGACWCFADPSKVLGCEGRAAVRDISLFLPPCGPHTEIS
jgi:hypothetical protein